MLPRLGRPDTEDPGSTADSESGGRMDRRDVSADRHADVPAEILEDGAMPADRSASSEATRRDRGAGLQFRMISPLPPDRLGVGSRDRPVRLRILSARPLPV
jgi:hypothetical protein